MEDDSGRTVQLDDTPFSVRRVRVLVRDRKAPGGYTTRVVTARRTFEAAARPATDARSYVGAFAGMAAALERLSALGVFSVVTTTLDADEALLDGEGPDVAGAVRFGAIAGLFRTALIRGR